ncbi:hypothetical protein Mal48_08570 [Thalassoglobus polymorphus]|uniref:Uncharacterized protein n=1 Tax=Thalassoglobus polymorphus TaxID=2527994 RepID=A0A517QIZ3_9PLAN|nr:hypothetical protein Mal48_08570 [Thalassoglobus polymorphus]
MSGEQWRLTLAANGDQRVAGISAQSAGKIRGINDLDQSDFGASAAKLTDSNPAA